MGEFDSVFNTFIEQSLAHNKRSVDNITAKIKSPSANTEEVNSVARLFDEAVQSGIYSGIQSAHRSIRDGSFDNPLMGTGISNAMLSAGHFNLDLISLHRTELLAIYNGSWVLRRAIDKPARDMWSKGIEITYDGESDSLKDVYSKFREVRSDMIFATKLARLFGGSAALMMVDDGETDLSKPLNLNNIRKGSKLNFLITDRYWGLEWSSEKVDDYESPDFGTPMYYSFFLEGNQEYQGIKVHHSRVLRFVNRRSPQVISQLMQGWGISELEHMLQDLMNYENIKNSISGLLNKALLEIVKLEGMRNTMSGLSAGNAQASQMFSAQMAALNNYRTSNKIVFMDKQDEYDQHAYSFSGLDQILSVYSNQVSGAAEMPEIMLFGTNRAGLNGDKPVELVIYSDKILGDQEDMLQKVVTKLLRVVFRICGLDVPQSLNFEFVRFLEDTTTDKQAVLSMVVNACTSMMDAGMMTRETALEEIISVQKSTGFGIKIDERDKNLAKEMDRMERENPEGQEVGMAGEETEHEVNIDTPFGSETTKTFDSYEEAKNNIIHNIRNNTHKRSLF